MTLLSKCGVAVTLTMMMFEATALNNVDKYQMPTSVVSVNESNDTRSKNEEGKAFVFDVGKLLGNGKKNKANPLINNNISLENGVFGLTYGTTVSEMTTLFGIPTSEYKIDEEYTLYSYGRNLWVLTKHNRVTRIQNDNRWIPKRLSNYMAFDDRPTNNWVLGKDVKKGDSKKTLIERLSGSFVNDAIYRIQNKETGIYIDIELALASVSKDEDWAVYNYVYGNVDDESDITLSRFPANAFSYQDLYTTMIDNRLEDESTNIGELKLSPIFTAATQHGNLLFVYDNHLAIISSDNEIEKVLLSNAFFDTKAKATKWRYGELYSRQSSNLIKKMFEDKIFELADNYWELDLNGFKYELFFEKSKTGDMELTEIEFQAF
jgi:hypothetical protein